VAKSKKKSEPPKSKKKSEPPKIQVKRGDAIEALVKDMATWEPHVVREWGQAERRNQLAVLSNADLLVEYANLVDESPTDSIVATHKIVGSEDPEGTFELLLEAIDEECNEHENLVAEAEGAIKGAEHRGTDFQDALRIAWKLLTPAQRKQAFAEFKEDHDFVPLPGEAS